jgi:hypothetical protein
VAEPRTQEESPTQQVSSAAHPQPDVAEAPRRRSTVREPALLPGSDERAAPTERSTPLPSAAPVVSSPAESGGSDRPRRSGWWSRRSLGKD